MKSGETSKILKDVGMEVTKSVETRKHPSGTMACNTNNMRNMRNSLPTSYTGSNELL